MPRQSAKTEETPDPDGVIARPVGDDRVGGQHRVQAPHDGRHVHRALACGWLAAPFEVIGAGLPGASAPRQGAGRLQAFERGREGLRGSLDAEVGVVDPADLVGRRVNVDQPLTGRRHIEQGVGLRGHFRHPPREDDEVGVRDAGLQPGVRPDADLPRVVGVIGVEQAGAAERCRDRKVEARGEARRRGAGLLAPPAAAQDQDRPLGRPQPFLQGRHLGEARPGQHRLHVGRVGDGGPVGQHVFGQRDHHRAGAALQGDVESARHEFRDAGRIVDLDHPFGDRAEEGPVIHLLEGAAPAHAALDLADEQDQRHRIMLGDVDTMGGVGGAGAAGHHGDAGAAGEPGARIRHHGGPTFLPAHRQGDRGVVQGVEHGKIAFARHAEDMLDPLGHQLVDEDAAAGPGC